MKKLPLWFPFSLACFYALFGSAFFPSLHFHPFAPFLAILSYKTSFLKALWIASFSGLILDCTSSHLYFGLYALNYCLTLALLYTQKRHFFEDKPLSIPLFTILVSLVSTLIEIFFLVLTGNQIPMSSQFFGVECFIMPLFDGVFAYLWFILPCQGFLFIQKRGVRFMLRTAFQILKKVKKDSEN